MTLQQKISWVVVVVFLGVVLGSVVTYGWWMPQVTRLVDKLLTSEDQGASDKIAAQGANDVTNQLDEATKVNDKIKVSRDDAVRIIRSSTTSSTKLATIDVNRLRAADVELCKLGVICSSKNGGSSIREPTPTPATPVGATPVRAVRPTDAGDTDLSGP